MKEYYDPRNNKKKPHHWHCDIENWRMHIACTKEELVVGS